MRAKRPGGLQPPLAADAHLKVEVPRELTEKQRSLLSALAQEMNVPVEENEGFLEKLKGWFGRSEG